MTPGRGSRPDGRRPEEMRSAKMRTAAVPNAAGSAYVEQGRTKVLAAIYGPRQADGKNMAATEGSLTVDIQFTAFSSKYGRKGDERRLVLYNSLLQSALESVILLDRYMKTQIDIHILVLEDDGAVLTAGLTAASLALADAAIEVVDLVAGATVHRAAGEADGRGQLLLDCDGDEESAMPDGSSVVHLGLCSARNRVCLLHSAGPVPPEPLERMVLLAKETAQGVAEEMSRCLVKRVTRRAVKRQRHAEIAEAEIREEEGEDDDDAEEAVDVPMEEAA